MKKSILMFFLPAMIVFIQLDWEHTFCGCKKNEIQLLHQNDSLLFIKLSELNKKKFLGHMVENFLKDELISKYKSYHFLDEPLGTLDRVSLGFSKRIQVYIYISEYKYVKQIDESRKWNFQEYKKENISEIDLIYDNQIAEIVGNRGETQTTFLIPGIDSVKKMQ